MEPVKNKKLTYLLICVVAVVWGIIVQRVFFNEAGEDGPMVFKSKQVSEPYDQYSARNDTFKLVLDYRDPFTGIEAKPVVLAKVSAGGQKIRRPRVEEATPVDWSVVKYSGYIVNPANKHLVAIVSVNGVERMISEGQSLNGLKLLSNRKDSILVSYMGKQKYIRH